MEARKLPMFNLQYIKLDFIQECIDGCSLVGRVAQWRPSTEELLSWPVKPYGFDDCCKTSGSNYRLRSWSITTTSTTCSCSHEAHRGALSFYARAGPKRWSQTPVSSPIGRFPTSSPRRSDRARCNIFRRCLGYNISTCHIWGGEQKQGEQLRKRKPSWLKKLAHPIESEQAATTAESRRTEPTRRWRPNRRKGSWRGANIATRELRKALWADKPTEGVEECE